MVCTKPKKCLELRGRAIIKKTGGQTNEVRYTVGAIDSPSDLDWGELENYGADSAAGRYLVNHDGTCDYGDISDPTEIEAYQVCGRESIARQYDVKDPRAFKQLRGKMQGSKSKAVPVK